MEPTPKTDMCISILKEIGRVLNPIHYHLENHAKDMIEKHDSIMRMVCWRLLPGERMIDPLLLDNTEINPFKYEREGVVTKDDLKEEFRAMCPNPGSIPEYARFMEQRFSGVDRRYDTDINIIKEKYNVLDEHVKAGRISGEDAWATYMKILWIGSAYNSKVDEIRELYRELGGTAKPQQTPTDTDTAKPQLYFTRSFSEAEQKKLYTGLVKGGFLPQTTNYSHFCYVFGGEPIPDDERPFEPLQWEGTIKELNYFITIHFAKQRNQWETAVNCFWKDNKPINKKSLTTAMDKLDNEPGNSTIIDRLL